MACCFIHPSREDPDISTDFKILLVKALLCIYYIHCYVSTIYTAMYLLYTLLCICYIHCYISTIYTAMYLLYTLLCIYYIYTAMYLLYTLQKQIGCFNHWVVTYPGCRQAECFASSHKKWNKEEASQTIILQPWSHKHWIYSMKVVTPACNKNNSL